MIQQKNRRIQLYTMRSYLMAEADLRYYAKHENSERHSGVPRTLGGAAKLALHLGLSSNWSKNTKRIKKYAPDNLLRIKKIIKVS